MKKSHRLLLNFTPEVRTHIQLLILRSGAETESIVIRDSFYLYSAIYSRVARGDEAIMHTIDHQQGYDLDILTKWEAPTESSANKAHGIRQRIEIKLESACRKEIDSLIELGVAPTITALAYMALNTFGQYVRGRNENKFLFIRDEFGRETLVIVPEYKIRFMAWA